MPPPPSAGPRDPTLPPATTTEPEMPVNLRAGRDAYERQLLVDALERTQGNQTQAAKLLGISRRHLIARIEQFGLPRPRKGTGA